MKYAMGTLIGLMLLTACAQSTVEVRTPSFDEQLPPPQADYSRGSLWQGDSRSLVEDHKARRRGDTITILIVESASASKQASTDTSRSNSASAGIPNLLGLETSKKVTSWADLSNLINASYDSKFAGSGSTSRKESLTATISAKVMTVLPNGNLQIEGRRNVKVNNEDQSIKVEGTVRPRDIAADNTISSSLIADAQITYAGKGVISDQQSPGWLSTILNKIWPF
jgi:flagellar L-ring protein precursor FlgH